MLPEGYTWVPRHLSPQELDLHLDGKGVAQLHKTMDNTRWFVLLDRHWPIEAPLVIRPCESRESGIAGLERWAQRHRERLRAEIADPRLQAWRVAAEED